jgi:hypothetical protein
LHFRGDDNVKGRGGGVIVRSVAPKDAGRGKHPFFDCDDGG